MVEMMTSQDPPLMHDLQYDKQYMSIIKPAWSYLWTKSDSISFTTQSSTLLVTKRNPEAITMKLKLLALLLLQLAMSISAPLPAKAESEDSAEPEAFLPGGPGPLPNESFE
ncbi:MAG: hypothetical protein HETSPECPRED_003708 [Heterodermia speciosa]|uniref:Uncharacterized protein n=1 Tax=Heterodermia speciosa TaxID=116794 RepID=A0A8H3FA15_9LECA|nr:MAG: hypothetical protein HETSPECPRED_003708 [Heterodermia speciosa]